MNNSLRLALLASASLATIASGTCFTVATVAQEQTWLPLGSAVQGPEPGTADYNAVANWNPNTAVPGAASTVTFGTTSNPNISFGAGGATPSFTSNGAAVGGWSFSADGPKYNFTLAQVFGPARTPRIYLLGTGITGNSSNVTINLWMDLFPPPNSSQQSNPQLIFGDYDPNANSGSGPSAGYATIETTTTGYSAGGTISFYGGSTADHATFNSTGDTTVDGGTLIIGDPGAASCSTHFSRTTTRHRSRTGW